MYINTPANSGENLKRDAQIEPVKVIARYVNGKVMKGYTHDFFPNKQIFRISPSIDEHLKEGTKIQVLDLKALFFVRDFTGNPSYNEQKHFSQDKQFLGRKIEVTFKDNEVLVGTTVGYAPQRLGFFLFPVDPESNNLRVFVISAAVRKVRFL
jgi:hypothetical protein